jgi:hypothetical protein
VSERYISAVLPPGVYHLTWIGPETVAFESDENIVLVPVLERSGPHGDREPPDDAAPEAPNP